MAQWLRFHTRNAWGSGSIHGPETKILKAAQCPPPPQKEKNLTDNETNPSLEVTILATYC